MPNAIIIKEYESVPYAYTSEICSSTTSDQIDELFKNFTQFLKEKNRLYSDSAINPIQIFSKSDANNQICNRLDDKLSRIKTSDELRKNDVCDVFGYVALLMIANGWIEFRDLLD